MTQQSHHTSSSQAGHWRIWLVFFGTGALIGCLVLVCGVGLTFGRGRFSAQPSATVMPAPTLTAVTLTADPPIGTPTPIPTPTANPLPDPATILLPPRNRQDLAVRLRGVDPATIKPPAPRAYSVGDVESFWVADSHQDQVFQVQADLVYIGTHVYMWVEQGYSADVEPYISAAQRFDDHIYPATTGFFGSEPNPGIDGDPRLHILHSARLGGTVAGYFYSPSEYPASAVQYSNQKEMFYINISNTPPTSSDYDSVLAHEFQHMIHWNVDNNEESWMNEGLSELSAFLNGYGMSQFVGSFLNNPNLQLTAWPEEGTAPHYGAGYLFVAYFFDRYGSEATRQLIADPANGLDSIDRVLADIDPGRDADDLFGAWVLANVINDPAVLGGLYSYPSLPNLPRPDFSVSTSTYPYSTGDRLLNQYGAEYLRLYGPATVRIAFTGMQTSQLFEANTINTDSDPATPDQIVWWSNRGDDSDMTLTRRLDLSGVDQAALEFDTWFHIESLWDYAYVEVSADGGATWSIIPTPHTTGQNPNGTAYGPGYTGSSGDFRDANADGWLHESIDLSPYAGREILLRFELITDDAVNQPGLVLDNICVPVINWCDDAESADPGWDARGFLRHNNVLRQRYLVQLIHGLPDGSVEIVPLTLDALNQGWLEVTLDGLYPSILVVSGLTRHTTEPALYRVDIDPVDG